MATSQLEEKKDQTKNAIDDTAENIKDKTDKAKDKAKSGVETATEKAKDMANEAANKAKSAGNYVKEKADQGASYAGETVESWGESVRKHGPQEGMLGKANSAIASTLEQTGEYLEEKGVSGMASDMTTLIKKHPIPAVLIGIGLGFALARMTSRS